MPFHLTLDRIEEGIAVLLSDDGGRLLVPASELPPDCRDGSVLSVVFQPDPVETEARTARVRHIQERLLERGGH